MTGVSALLVNDDEVPRSGFMRLVDIKLRCALILCAERRTDKLEPRNVGHDFLAFVGSKVTLLRRRGTPFPNDIHRLRRADLSPRPCSFTVSVVLRVRPAVAGCAS